MIQYGFVEDIKNIISYREILPKVCVPDVLTELNDICVLTEALSENAGEILPDELTNRCWRMDQKMCIMCLSEFTGKLKQYIYVLCPLERIAIHITEPSWLHLIAVPIPKQEVSMDTRCCTRECHLKMFTRCISRTSLW